jgi:2-C-methyl-D-erythritol 4-phosphate cytidylyltransferase
MVSAIIVAAGSGRRMGFDKMLVQLHGKPVLYWSLAAFQQCPEVDDIIAVTARDAIAEVEQIVQTEQLSKVRSVVAGGAERHLSVWNGLQAVEIKGWNTWPSMMGRVRSSRRG